MKNTLILLITSLFAVNSYAQNKVVTADFARRPQFYQGKTILLSNITIAVGNDQNNNTQNTSRNRTSSSSHHNNEKNWSSSPGTPRCKPLSGWNLIQPEIPNLNAPMCFAVISKIYDRLPQNKTFKADILVEIDVRGICKINRIRVLR